MDAAGSATHWNDAYGARPRERLSWHEAEPGVSLELVAEAGLARDVAILDAGGGASALAGALLDAGYADVTVADLSPAALELARAALGERADRVRWVEADLRDHDFGRRFDLWHDRAVLHFMVAEDERERYLATLRGSLAPGGHVIIGTFAPDGPERCSGLPVRRYGPQDLLAALGPGFELVSSRRHTHHTPGGAEQRFCFAHLRRTTGSPAARQA